MNTNFKLSVLALLAAISVAACSQKPSTEEVAAQVKIELEKEKAQQAAQTAEVASQVAAQVKEALAEEKAKQVAATPEPVKKVAEPKHETVKAKPVHHESAAVMQPVPTQVIEQPVKHVCENCGMVLAVNMVEDQGKGSGLGVIGGGLVGGLLGNQVGNGTGRDVATLAGVVGGAFAGNAIEKNAKKTHHYEITVRMDNGTERTYHQATDPGLASGAKVKIENDIVIRN
jgi:outer membrane lipoprotein SlyB